MIHGVLSVKKEIDDIPQYWTIQPTIIHQAFVSNDIPIVLVAKQGQTPNNNDDNDNDDD